METQVLRITWSTTLEFNENLYSLFILNKYVHIISCIVLNPSSTLSPASYSCPCLLTLTPPVLIYSYIYFISAPYPYRIMSDTHTDKYNSTGLLIK